MAGSRLPGFSTRGLGQQAGLRATPEEVLGPFFPLRLPIDQDADLTQMYLEGEALNDKDVLLQRKSEAGRKSLIASSIARSGQQEPNALVTVWNIVSIAG